MTTTSEAPAATARPRSRRSLVATALVPVLALGAGAWWVTHPSDAFRQQGSTMALPVAVGETGLAGLFVGAGREVTLRDVRPVLTTNTADATVRVVLCQPVADLIGSGRGTVESACSRVLPLEGAALSGERAGRPYLLVAITPKRAGTVVVDGVEISYRDGVRRGTETAGVTVKVDAG